MTDKQERQPDRLSIEVDYEKYAHFLESADWSEDQKREYAQMIWNIIVDFVSLGFGVHPVQQAEKGCISIDEIQSHTVSVARKMVKSSNGDLKKNYKSAAGSEGGTAAKGGSP